MGKRTKREYEGKYINDDGMLTVAGVRMLVALGEIKLNDGEKIIVLSSDEYAEKIAREIGDIRNLSERHREQRGGAPNDFKQRRFFDVLFELRSA